MASPLHPARKPQAAHTRFRLSPALVRTALYAGLALSALSGAASAQTSVQSQALRNYHIPAGSLGSVLNQFAQAAGVELSAAADLTQGKRSPGLQGRYSVQDGFMHIVQAHQLQVIQASNGTYSLRTATSAANSANVSALAPITVAAQARSPYQAVSTLTAQQATSATKTDTPLLEAPQTINVVTRKQIEMQGAQTVNEAVAYTPGVIAAFGGTDRRYDVVMARGGLFVRQYLDGIVLPFSAYSVSVPQFDPYMLEVLEILQGPSSGLFGQTTPGGVLNMVSRRPQAESAHELWIQGGYPKAGKLAFDSTGALDTEQKLLYRVSGLINDADGMTDFSEEKRSLIAPSFTWRPSADTTFTLLTHYQHDKVIPQYQGLPAKGTLYANPNGSLPHARFAGEPTHERMDREQYALGYTFEHHVNDTWTVRQNLRYTHVDIDTRGTPGYALDADQRTLRRVATQGLGKGSIMGVDTHAQADFSTGPLDHTLLLGVDYVKQKDDYRFASALAGSIDLYNPVYGIEIPQLNQAISNLQTMTQTGLYLQDQMRAGAWILTAGGRYDHVNADTENRKANTVISRSERSFTGRLGLNYLFDNGVAPYASYSTSFEPVGGTDFNSTPFKSMKGKQAELGVKYQAPGSDTLITVSAFHLEQKNMLTPDTQPGHEQFSTQTGEVRSRGINLELRTRLWDNTDLIGAYAFTRSKITKANPNGAGMSLEGLPLPRVPRHMASLWANHELDHMGLKGLSAGVGVRYIGANYADSAATLHLPANTLWDAAIHYDLGKANPDLHGFKLSLTASNLADRKYVNYCLNELQCFYGQGRTVLLNLRKQW